MRHMAARKIAVKHTKAGWLQAVVWNSIAILRITRSRRHRYTKGVGWLWRHWSFEIMVCTFLYTDTYKQTHGTETHLDTFHMMLFKLNLSTLSENLQGKKTVYLTDILWWLVLYMFIKNQKGIVSKPSLELVLLYCDQ